MRMIRAKILTTGKPNSEGRVYQRDAVVHVVRHALMPIYSDCSINADVFHVIASAQLEGDDLYLDLFVHEERADMMAQVMSEGGRVGVGLVCAAIMEGNTVRPVAIYGVTFTDNPTFEDAQVVKIYE